VDWAASPCLPQVLRLEASERKRPLRATSMKVLARKWRPTSALPWGAKKVCRRKISHINGFWLETRLKTRKNGAFAPRKTASFRHFIPCPFWAPARLGPGLKTASGAKGTRSGPCHRAMMNIVCREERRCPAASAAMRIKS
jgi:hypothetical protein